MCLWLRCYSHLPVVNQQSKEHTEWFKFEVSLERSMREAVNVTVILAVLVESSTVRAIPVSNIYTRGGLKVDVTDKKGSRTRFEQY
ncbi:hypothetical protein NPIL_556681 [Nephila pilipes]|uniref:Uncharacterized protein n=1 Tax=Nephila pilipes TaxID=299642 RepID=A0A8X6N1K1_NEPPI|nr:hypothetical protein NPIL_556681 [Nephila pilipes]